MPETRKGSKGEVAGEDSLRMILEDNKRELLNEMRKINDSLDFLKSKVNNFEETLTTVLKTQERQDYEIKSLKSDFRSIKDDYDHILNEMEERDRRRPNIIVSGIVEKEDGTVEERKQYDKAKVETLLQNLCDFNSTVVTSIHRIGKVNSSKPRLLKIICGNTVIKHSLLRKAKELRRIPSFERVYLNPDETPLQQRESKRLREELRRRRALGEDVLINRGRIVEKQATQNFR